VFEEPHDVQALQIASARGRGPRDIVQEFFS
jgi:hypothetical protein